VLLADVNLYVYAFRPDSENHQHHRSWLTSQLSGYEPFGVSEMVLSSFVRIVTNSRIFRRPDTPEAALAFCDAVLDTPAAVRVRPGPRHWEIFGDLCRSTRARGNAVPDAYLAALALEHGATLATHDHGFRRFSGLRVEVPSVS
jgi:toxin-antitoxin system PIN domain toxin